MSRVLTLHAVELPYLCLGWLAKKWAGNVCRMKEVKATTVFGDL